MRRLLIALAIAVAVVVIALYLAPQRSVDDLYVRSDGGEGGVTVQATYLTEQYLRAKGREEEISRYQLDRYIAFNISMDTHSGDLRKNDLKRDVVLRNDKGITVSALSWEPLSDDAHHLSGVMKFPKQGSDGKPIIGDDTRYLELVVYNIAGVKERVLRWELAR